MHHVPALAHEWDCIVNDADSWNTGELRFLFDFPELGDRGVVQVVGYRGSVYCKLDPPIREPGGKDVRSARADVDHPVCSRPPA